MGGYLKLNSFLRHEIYHYHFFISKEWLDKTFRIILEFVTCVGRIFVMLHVAMKATHVAMKATFLYVQCEMKLLVVLLASLDLKVD